MRDREREKKMSRERGVLVITQQIRIWSINTVWISGRSLSASRNLERKLYFYSKYVQNDPKFTQEVILIEDF